MRLRAMVAGAPRWSRWRERRSAACAAPTPSDEPALMRAVRELADGDPPADRTDRTPSAADAAVEHVVLDPALRRADARRFDALFDAFAAGYLRHFSGDEAESTAEWRHRIEGKASPQPVMRIVVAVHRTGS